MPARSHAFDNAVGPNVRNRVAGSQRGFAVLAVLALVVGAQVATQVCARDFRYQSALGTQLLGFYPPWSIGTWSIRWGTDYPAAFERGAYVGMLTTQLGLLLLLAIQWAIVRSNPYLHGSARWAGADDVKRSGLLGPRRGNDGVYVGAYRDQGGRSHYLRHAGPEHVLCFAPTRSGKGVGLVVPTLLSWPHSAFVTDLKGELWALTAGWRRKGAGNRVLRFEPAAADGSVRWNPLDEIRIGTEYEVADVQNLATLIVDPDGKGLETHWQKTAQALLVGVILHVLYRARLARTPATLSEVDRLLADSSRPVSELWDEMTAYSHLDSGSHPAVATAGRDMIDRPPEEAGSVLSTAKSYLALYRDPIVAHNTAASDFRLRDLMHSSDPVTLYLVTQPVDKDRLRPLVRALVNMALRALADRLEFEGGQPKPHYRHRLLLMLDEFVAIRRLEILQESLAFVAGYGIKAYLICQDLEQLRATYGREETITSNCHVQLAFPPNRLDTAEHLSRLTGQTTVAQQQMTTSAAHAALFPSHSRTTQWVQRPLLTPDECLRLPGPLKDSRGRIVEPGDMLVFVAGFPAIYGRQPLYFTDPIFKARAALPAPGGGK